MWSYPPLFDYTIQSDLPSLLNAKTKREAEKIAREMVLKSESFAGLILEPDRFGFSHRRKHFDHIPEARRPKPGEIDQVFGTDDAARIAATRKITAMFRERKMVNAHLFEREREWHVFYFSQHDWQGTHGAMGPHVHYVSHLFLPQLSAGLVWQELDKRIYDIGNDVHVRISDESVDAEAALRRHRNKLKRERRARRGR